MNGYNLIEKNLNELEEISDNFKINKNIIEFNNRLVQLNNVESVAVVKAKKKTIGSNFIILSIVSLVFFSIAPILGLILLIIVGYDLYSIKSYNDSLGNKIFINLVSGHYIVIHCKNKPFAYKIMDIIKDYLNNSKLDSITFNINDSTVTLGDNSPIIGD